jgi:8-oxo-dGTP pyrophosphatase MutT (NUDIX family)
VRKRYLTSREAADALGIGVSTLQRWAADGLVTPAWRTPGKKGHGHARWDLADLERQLDMPPQPQEQPVPPGHDPAAPVKPPVAAAIVTSKLGVLVERRHDGRPLWTFPAGEIEPGEAPADTAIRETKEECGLQIVISHVIGERDHPKTGTHMFYLAARPYQGTEVHNGDENELAEVRWVPLAEAEELLVGMFEPVHAHLKRTLR